MKSTTIGIDLAKSVFQVSVADEQRRIVKRQPLSRSQFRHFLVHTPPAKLVMEGCASAHHWGRLALAQGHEVKLLHAGSSRKLGHISRRGDIYLRTMLIHGTRAALLAAKRARKRGTTLITLQRTATGETNENMITS